jgi:large subunit ribosomal protein L23
MQMSDKSLFRAYVTEKTSNLINFNKFTFLSLKSINKIELKKQLSALYDINIDKINVLTRLAKKVRRGKTVGKTRSFQKVVITLKDDKNIEKLKELF